MKAWGIALAVAIAALALALGVRRTQHVEFDYEIEAPVSDVVGAFAAIERYPEWTGGQADRGVIRDERESTDAAGNRIVEVDYSVWAIGIESSGTRVYTYAADGSKASVELRFFTWLSLEDASTRWEFEEVDGRTYIRQRGTRTTPWLFSAYPEFHSEQVLAMFQRIEHDITSPPEVAAPGAG